MEIVSALGVLSDTLSQWIMDDELDILMLDSRPFLAFNEGNISSSCNVRCPPILKRRSGGFVALENIVPCEQKRSKLRSGQFDRVVVYDDETVDLESAAKDSNLYSVLKSLYQQLENTADIYYLKGGFREFKRQHSHLCVGQNTPCISTSIQQTGKNTKLCEPVEILPYLYLGNSQDASQLEVLHRLGITSLMNVSTNCKNHFEENFSYMNIPVDDNDSADLAVWFPQTISFIDSVKEKGGKVLLHCQAGISRSATVCLAYLMSSAKVDLETAFEHVRSRRSVISPNLNFMRQLQVYEKELETSNTLSTSLSDASLDSAMETSSNDVSSGSSGAQSGKSQSASSFSQEPSYSGGAFDFSFGTSFSQATTPLLSPS
ncbi:hypothetical protein FSP39_000537 [Pinctada imbricata]|uniref:Protein-serine/threonine phosphatase n=1 Tax=Pinctada imbricata TaxID=66713 RepID=A0AA88YD78_PINIB|nr:hypothetical protein FSP39_000537 [Pinctada imbricata]